MLEKPNDAPHKNLSLPPSGVEPALWLCFYCPLTFGSRAEYLEHDCAPREGGT
jgi:hypothetical protein